MNKAIHLSQPDVYPETARTFDASLWRKEASGVRCLACVRRCLLHEGSVGFCSAVVNWQGVLHSTAFGVIGEAGVTPIENRPVYHYHPGSRVLSLGGLGCNLRCAFCQNWEIAYRDARYGGNLSTPNLSPEQAIELALKEQCAGIAWTFNEPSIAPMYTLECARLAHQAGLYTVFVTNGFMTNEALDLLGPYIDVYRVDIKSMKPSFYQLVGGTTHIAEILPIAQRAKQEFGIHVETVTNIMMHLNDEKSHLLYLTEQIVRYLGVDTPWHVSSYVPYAKMTHVPPTTSVALQHARACGVQSGLRFVYTDDESMPETSNTFCPTCNVLVIERHGHIVKTHALDEDGNCASCGTLLGIVVTPQELSEKKEVRP